MLAAACSGRLTADCDYRAGESDNCASIEPLYDVPSHWKWTVLQELIDRTRGICYGVIKLGETVPDGIPCLRTSDVKPLSIDADGVKKISSDISAEYTRSVLRGGEVLVNVRGTLGGVAVVPDYMLGWNVSREVSVVPVDSASPRYIALWIGLVDHRTGYRKLPKA